MCFSFEGIEHTARSPPQTARRLVDLFETDNPDNRRIQHKGRAATNALRLLAARASPVLTLNIGTQLAP